MATKKTRQKSPLPAIVLLIIALVALVYSEYSNVTGGFVGASGPASAGFGIGHGIAIVCLLATAAIYWPRKK